MEFGPGDLVVATLGRLTAVKGQVDLVRAFADLLPKSPQARLLFIGDGEQQAALRALTVKVGVAERTISAGWRRDVGDVLRAVDIFALPSHNEGMGKALVEAMYVGCPAIATNVGGIPELITDGVQGLLVPPRKPSFLATALRRLANDATLRRRLSDQAIERARMYDSHSMVQKLRSLYEELATAAPTRTSEAAVALQPS